MFHKTIFVLVAAIIIAAAAGTIFIVQVQAQNNNNADPVLERDPITGNVTEEPEMTIRPGDTIPPNGTITLSMEGMEEVDFKGVVPAGVTVIINNETATVTNQVVDIQDQTPPATPAPAAEEEEE